MTIYVAKYGNNSNTGTELSPFLTIQKAIDMVQSPDTIIIDDGIYNERVELVDKHDLSIKSKNTRMAIIDGTGIGTDIPVPHWQGLLHTESSSDINIWELYIRNTILCGVASQNSSNISILNNYIDTTSSSGILCFNGSNIVVDRNEINRPHMTTSLNYQEPMSFSQLNGFEIKNNYVHDGGGLPLTGGCEGINVKDGCNNGTVHHNKVVNMNSLGIYCDAWDKLQQNIKIYNNFCKNTGWAGLAISGEIGGTLDGIKIYNNVSTSSENGILIPAYNVSGGDAHLNNINIHNNTFYNNNYSGGVIGQYQKTLIDNLILEDNLFSNGSVGIIWQNRDRHTNVIIDHNYYDIFQQRPDSYYGTDYVVGGDPLFIDPANDDFNLQANSPAIGYGAYPYPLLCGFAYTQ